MTHQASSRTSPWPHRLAVLLVCMTFPLIWVGGLVTTYEAGMAVPDWPTTYGYNLFLYPWTTWLFGPWNLFIEHGHRLLAAVVGMIAIAVMIATFLGDGRRWVHWLSAATLAMVIFQGVLGGARVLWDERQLAMVHGCVGPLFFAMATLLAVVTSSVWKQAARIGRVEQDASRLHRWALLTAVLVFLQIVLGAQLRHAHPMTPPSAFQVAVVFHVAMAVVLAVHGGVLTAAAYRWARGLPAVTRPALLLSCLLVLQLGLGAGSWVVKYAWPLGMMDRYLFAAAHVNEAKSLMTTTTVTAHVAMGSLILAVSVLLAARSLRLVRSDTATDSSKEMLAGAVA